MNRLVDLDLSIRCLASEIPLDADLDLDAFRDTLRDAMAAWTMRGLARDDALVTVTVVVREV